MERTGRGFEPVIWREALRASIATRAVFVNIEIGGPRPRYVAGARAAGLSPADMVDTTTALEAVDALAADLRSGDVVLVEGAAQQHLDRIVLALHGRSVGCEIPVCTAWMRCADCPMLERGWDDPTMTPTRSRT